MKLPKSLLKDDTVFIDLVRLGLLLTGMILVLLTISCSLSRRGDEIETTPARYYFDNGVEFWCLEKTDFTAVLQEADRCR